MSDTLPPSSSNTPRPTQEREDYDLTERKTLRDYVIILRERLWVALPVALLLAVVLGFIQSRESRQYQSRATMRFEKPDRIVTTEYVTNPAVQSEVDINTNIQTLRSNRIRERVVRSFTAEEIRILQRPYLADLEPGMPPPAAGAALGRVDITSVPNSLIIAVIVTHRDPEAAKLIADRFVQQFMQFLIEDVSGKNVYAVEYLQKSAERLRAESEQASLKLQQYMQQQKLVSLDENSNLVTARLQAAEAELTRTRLARIDLEGQYTQVQAFKETDRNLLEITFVANHGQVPSLKAQQTELIREQTVLTERYLERHPRMIEVANRLAVVQSQLDAAIKLAIADLKTRLEQSIASEAKLETEKSAQEKEIFQLRDMRGEYESLRNQAAVASKNYIDVLDRLNQTRTSSNIDKIPIRILDIAEISGSPISPNAKVIARNCISVFVISFLVIAIGLSFIDDRIKSSWDVEHFIGVPLLGIVPELPESAGTDRHRLVLNNHPSPGLEAFLSVYSSVKIHSKTDFPKAILVTSTIPGEGKTLVSANLAGSFARHGRKTLLIDCDLRRPMMHHHFSQHNNHGVIPWFEAGADLESNLETNPNLGIVKLADNLHLLCSGGRTKTPTDLFESRAFGQLVARLKAHYELIVIDSPPLGAVTDSLLIAEQADEVLYVCRFNRAYKKHIRMYVNALRDGKHELLGVVLNGLTPRRIEYYSNYRYYRSYKKYYGSQT